MTYVAIAIILMLMVVNGVFALSEMAVVSSRKVRLEQLARQSDPGARAALKLVADPGGFLSTVQIGITLVGIIAGAYGGATLSEPLGAQLDRLPWVAPHGDQVAIVMIVVAITYLSLVVGELVPKRIALANPEYAAAKIARPMIALSRVTAPAVWLLRISSDILLRLLRLSSARRASITEDEVKALIAEGTRAGTFVPEEQAMIEGVLRLADRTVQVIMTQRSDIAWIDKSASRETIKELVDSSPHTEFLVGDGSIDNAIGLAGARDLLRALLNGDPLEVATIVRPTLFVSERTPVLTLIDLFRQRGVKIAVVVDEYGATEGLVTATDVLEGIAGALPDRHEGEGPMSVRRPDGTWLIDGLLPIDEFEDICGVTGLRDIGDFNTVAGLVIHELGQLPKVGDRVERSDLTLEVVDMDGLRIDKLLVARQSGEDHPAAD